ncbi:hypothetical protein [Chitinimonas sp. BJB300]|uniref:hypothetical protein n=1 Tax=Chitinimonas sp. BJB300 TaxID=1559339 RepID=UPI000C0FFA9B|nr:hypothetical protein [Chitinimonas sp. BJB300]PHV11210.1 hypothetical protein CSQ89_12000 [Chitinimonas sp. BJB300]TSJ87368.1 hypothetical protein FG002_014120 [Chitinimonas sp. BJB300]
MNKLLIALLIALGLTACGQKEAAPIVKSPVAPAAEVIAAPATDAAAATTAATEAAAAESN